jgi:hypothetical protein
MIPVIFKILFNISVALTGAAAAIAGAVRLLIAFGLGRASIATLLAAYGATLNKAVMAGARSRIRERITILNDKSTMLYDDFHDVGIKFTYQGAEFLTTKVSRTGVLSDNQKMQAAINHIINRPGLGQAVIAEVKQERINTLTNLCSGLPPAVVAFFLGVPPAGAEDCLEEFIKKFYGLPDTGFFTERVYGWAETNAIAKRSSSGTWELEPLVIDLKIDIGAPLDEMRPEIYNEFLTWKDSLNVAQILDEIESQGNYNGVNYFQEINNQANAWVNSLNAGGL